MKTEKRLTMALSVLVALMMLAVPLASSSNLFVDGGQTNSNGDAPALGAAGDIITFELNIPENSLDKINYETLKTALAGAVTGIIFSVDEKKGTVLAIADGSVEVSISSIIDAVNKEINKQFRGIAYSHEWIDSNGSVYYPDGNINESFALTAQWALNEDEYAEVNVNSTIDGVAQEVKTKAYAYSTYDDDNDASTPEVVDKTQIVITTANGLPVDESLIKGYVFNDANGAKNMSVYDHKVTDSSNKTIKDPTTDPAGDVTIPVSDLTVTYTFNNEEYKKVTISSNIFEEPVMLYADKNVAAAYTYSNVFTALGTATPEGKTTPYINTAYIVEGKNSYTMKNWTDGGELYSLKSESPAGTELTLNADYNKFNVTFMVKGQVQVAEVLYGEFSESICTLDTNGMTKWVSLPVNDQGEVIYSGFDETTKPTIFNFNNPKLQDTIINNNLVLVALFTDPAKTYYVTFDAKAGYFGDKENGVQKIVVPISSKDATADQIILPENPINYAVAQGEKSVFAYWYSTNEKIKYDFSNETKITGNTVLNAEYIKYKYTISFNVDNNVVGYLYYDANKLVAFEYNGVAYTHSSGKLDNIGLTPGSDDSRALSALLYPTKAGHTISEWKDADGNVMISGIVHKTYDTATNPPEYEEVTGVTLHYTSVKEDMSFYASFVPEDYLIVYYANTATASNIMVQVGTVDEVLALFGESTFGNEGYVLKEWNTRPDGKGTSYTLGSDFTLSGSEYEDALDVPEVSGIPLGYDKCVILYAIWEKVGGSGSGDSTGGNGDNNTDTYLLAGILAVIIILILLIAFLMRRKN